MTDDSEPISIYRVDHGWVVADHGTWLPGCYDSEDTARAAADYSDSVLAEVETICSIHGEDRVITLTDLRNTSRKLGEDV